MYCNTMIYEWQLVLQVSYSYHDTRPKSSIHQIIRDILEPTSIKQSRKHPFLVCYPSSRQSKKQKIFLPGIVPGIFMLPPPAASFYKIPLVSRRLDSAELVCSYNNQYNPQSPLSVPPLSYIFCHNTSPASWFPKSLPWVHYQCICRPSTCSGSFRHPQSSAGKF